MVLISLVSVLNLLYFYISTFRIMCAVNNMAVFCSSLTSWFPGMLLTYFLNVFEIVPVAPICYYYYYYYYIKNCYDGRRVRLFVLSQERILWIEKSMRGNASVLVKRWLIKSE